MAEWGIYGGAGFIGQHLAHSILCAEPQGQVVLLDIRSPQESGWRAPLEPFLATGRLSFLRTDVREFDQLSASSGAFDVIVNLAAIHREPGHQREEYFETNVRGAKNVCRLAEAIDCQEIIFTSSISVYGVHDQLVDENSPPEPKTPYGQSKLEAESIHRAWAEKSGGALSIIRPGVVFGPGERGNVTRLVREMLKRERQILISPDQPKAGIYIEELLEIIHWLRAQPVGEGQCNLVNGASAENLSFNSYGRALQELRKFGNKPLKVAEPVLRLATLLMKPLGWVMPAGSKFHPERLAKLTRANDIRPTELVSRNYRFAWPLERALADWLEKGL